MANDQRRRVAYEAARLLYERVEKNRYRAKRRAAKRYLGENFRPCDLPTDREIRMQIEAVHQAAKPGDCPHFPGTVRAPPPSGGRRGSAKMGLSPSESPDRFRFYETLLRPLENVHEDRDLHPEGDLLYHSLQVFALARDALPYDEEFLLAALLHDVGKGIDPRDHVAAALETLDDSITWRTAWLIEHHMAALSLRSGTLGLRFRRRLQASENFEELMLLADYDHQGRAVGAPVPDIHEALLYLKSLAQENGE
jgi:hypothetical protein